MLKMETTTQELIYQDNSLVVGLSGSIVLLAIKKYIEDKEIQTLLNRAVLYVEQKGKE